MNIENKSNEILKTAGIASGAKAISGGIKGAGKFLGRSAGGAVLGAGLGATKGVGANEKDPYATQETKELNVLGGAAGGMLAGAAIAGPGIGMAKKIGKGALGIFKKSDMEVPNEEERGCVEDEDKDEVLESPNKDERKRMVNSISKEDEKKEHYKKQIEKSACGKE